MLLRQLYGTHDAPRAWFDLVRKHLVEEQKLEQSGTDECLFTGPGLYIIVHVDDFCCTGEDHAVAKFRQRLYERFDMTGGPITEYYGLQVTVDREQGTTAINARAYIRSLVKKLQHQPRKVSTPMERDIHLPKMEGECKDPKPPALLQTTSRLCHAPSSDMQA